MREYLLIFLVAAGTTYLLVAVSGKIAHLVGAVPPTRDRDVHRLPVPRLGGLAMLGGLIAAFLVASRLPHMGRVFAESSAPRGVLIAAVAMCLVGVADDIWGLSAVTKFAGQLVAAGLLLVEGVQLFWLPLPSGTPFVLDSTQGALLTVLLVVGTANAVNFVDGLDGLAAGVVGVGAAAFFAYAYVLTVEQGFTRLTMPALLTAVLCGVCIGFLPHNVHPARIFMGDSGALLLGLLLAAGTITLTGQFSSPDVQDDGGTFLLALLPLLIPVAVIALPFTDLVLAVWRRTGEGRSPFSPDKQHLHHRLLAIGHSHRRAVFVMWVWAGLIGFGIVVTALFGGWRIYVAVAVALVLTVLLTTGRPRRLLHRTTSAGQRSRILWRPPPIARPWRVMSGTAPVSFLTPMRRVLLATAIGLAVLLPLGTLVGWLLGGSEVGWGIFLGLAIPAAFLGLTVLVGVLAARLDNTRFVGVVVASLLVKLLLLVIVLAQLRGAEFYAAGAFFVAFVVGVAGWLLTEAVVVVKTRVPYVDEARGA